MPKYSSGKLNTSNGIISCDNDECKWAAKKSYAQYYNYCPKCGEKL